MGDVATKVLIKIAGNALTRLLLIIEATSLYLKCLTLTHPLSRNSGFSFCFNHCCNGEEKWHVAFIILAMISGLDFMHYCRLARAPDYNRIRIMKLWLSVPVHKCLDINTNTPFWDWEDKVQSDHLDYLR